MVSGQNTPLQTVYTLLQNLFEINWATEILLLLFWNYQSHLIQSPIESKAFRNVPGGSQYPDDILIFASGCTAPQTSEKLRLQIIKLNLQNLSVCQISKITNVHKSTVSRIIIRYNDRGHINNNKSPGRPKKVNERMERIVVRASKKTLF